MTKFLFFFAALLLAAASVGTGCIKEPDVITEKVIQIDTFYTHDTIVQQITDTLTLTKYSDTVTTFIVVRHAETSGTGSNPPLSTAGQLRATQLVRVLKNLTVGGIYASNYTRTMQTAQPVAVDHGVTVQEYDPLEPSMLADNVLSTHRGQTVLVVGHSNTVPSLLNTLTGTTVYANLPDTQYDNLYVVTVFEKGRAQVVHLKYGE